MKAIKKMTRRKALGTIGAAGAAALVGEATLLAATPEDLPETGHEGDGPFYKPGAPERANFREKGTGGTPFTLTGQVLNVHGKPLPGALLDFWHADKEGEYDNKGFHLRGRFHADTQGRYRLETIQPRWYGGRSAHFHVKVSAPEHPLLTTALYFKGDPLLAKDSMVKPALVLQVVEQKGERAAKFDFVLRDA
jgi:protocatechuate 3,4-dioxygenase beta subunit